MPTSNIDAPFDQKTIASEIYSIGTRLTMMAEAVRKGGLVPEKDKDMVAYILGNIGEDAYEATLFTSNALSGAQLPFARCGYLLRGYSKEDSRDELLDDSEAV